VAVFDVIVVGARCAGAPTAMLLARRGHRVLLVDRTRFPSDTLSTHFLQPRGAAMLARWVLLDRLRGTGLVGEDLQGSSRRRGRRRPWRSTWGILGVATAAADCRKRS
jgi:2-polyprenyl-6-methoxyphenol hydroxylase-like FAD-dependent oxidoreductase